MVRIYPLFLWLALLVAPSALSALNSFAQLSVDDLLSQSRSGQWRLCDSDNGVWCQEELSYYNQAGYAELSLVAHNVELEMLFLFSSHTLSELQLNLRRDGFILRRVLLGEALFDVEAQLIEAETEQQVRDLDKKLIQFLNQTDQNQPRVMHWRNDIWDVTLSSDGEIISLTLAEGGQ